METNNQNIVHLNIVEKERIEKIRAILALVTLGTEHNNQNCGMDKEIARGLFFSINKLAEEIL